MKISRRYGLPISYKVELVGDWSDPVFCLEAVQVDSSNIRFVENQTEEICLAALKRSVWCFDHIKKENQTQAMIDLLFTNTYQLGTRFHLIREDFKTLEMCKKALEFSGWAILKDIPDEHKTPELYKIAVTHCPDNIEHVPDQTLELIDIAVTKDPYTFKKVKNQTKELFLHFFEKDINVFCHAIINDMDVYRAALKLNPSNFRHIPKTHQTLELIKLAVANPKYLRGVIESINTDILPIKEWPLDWFVSIENTEIKRRFIKEHGSKIFQKLEDITVLEENEEYALVKYLDERIVGWDDEYEYVWSQALIYHCPSSGDAYFTEIDPSIEGLDAALTFLNNNILKESLAYES